jgi:hypothetical protein
MDNSQDFHDSLGRIHGFAVIDTVGTLVGALILSKLLKTSPFVTIPATFLVGHAVHVVLGIRTRLNNPQEEPDRVSKSRLCRAECPLYQRGE